ncbi:uncharacterized protein EV422DRAFT_226369 [Fimicolochytrium jonesii]|uniref:uncharacterized protein n=1 Tax=Fimicolochytrium jonesii TaxID=1396493 RepID=UPI0022FE01F9|nr:uncharacterized protein EV422DRAFT_226369 [Fimicolochytrium jonesii]KAI8817483.1 hypothetical protein EV422DRAFT_226369 [Fimicolochytrium jonesii]
MGNDLYTILGVSKNAAEEEIKRAYKAAVKKFHPDRNPGFKEEADAKFKELSGAYEVLSDAVKRKGYDQQQAEKRKEEATRPKEQARPRPDMEEGSQGEAGQNSTHASPTELENLMRRFEKLSGKVDQMEKNQELQTQALRKERENVAEVRQERARVTELERGYAHLQKTTEDLRKSLVKEAEISSQLQKDIAAMQPRNTTPQLPKVGQPRVWLDVSWGNERSGRIVIELQSAFPKAAENFQMMCVGNVRRYRSYRYTGTKLQSGSRGEAIESMEPQEVVGAGEGIYTPQTSVHVFDHAFRGEVWLSNQPCAQAPWNLQFSIAVKEHKYHGRCYVKIGKVVEGIDIVMAVEAFSSRKTDAYYRGVYSAEIVDCGQY